MIIDITLYLIPLAWTVFVAWILGALLNKASEKRQRFNKVKTKIAHLIEDTYIYKSPLNALQHCPKEMVQFIKEAEKEMFKLVENYTIVPIVDVGGIFEMQFKRFVSKRGNELLEQANSRNEKKSKLLTLLGRTRDKVMSFIPLNRAPTAIDILRDIAKASIRINADGGTKNYIQQEMDTEGFVFHRLENRFYVRLQEDN